MRLTIYSRPGCHLCDVMKDVATRVIEANRFSDVTIDEVDISTAPDLLERYGTDIPVLMIDGKKVAKYRIDEDSLRRMLETRMGRLTD